MDDVVDELHVKGVDGVIRSLNEHYDTLRDVDQDPYGAWLAIQNQADRIEALEARIAKADALLRITKGALGDIADGEPEWPDDPAKELEWCRNRALAAYREGKDKC